MSSRHAVNLDQVAVRVMLSNRPQADKQKILRSLAAQVTTAVHNTYACPSCGSRAPKETNGLRSDDPEFSLLCPCGESWSPNL